MFVDERHQAILDLLAAEGRVNAADLAERFHTTRETIRRDLTALEASRSLRRVHGGAVPFSLRSTAETNLTQRQGHNLAAKSRIARAALDLISDGGSSLVLDAGSTTHQLAVALSEGPLGETAAAEGGLVVATHSLPIAAQLSQVEGLSLEMVGGRLRAITQSAIGHETARRYENLSADVAFVGTNAVTPGFGLSTPDAEEAAVKHAIIEGSKLVVLLADAAKFTDPALNRFARLSEIDVLITDAQPPAALLADLEEADVDLRVV